MHVLKMSDQALAGKRVLIRADLNVPVKDGRVTSDARILATLPTITEALDKVKPGMTIMDVSYSAQNVVKGIVLLIALLFDTFLNPRNEDTAQQGDV